MEIPAVSHYGNAENTMTLSFIGMELYYSYKTLVAFRYNGRLVVRENDWSTTTGKHLNLLDGGDKKSRVGAGEFFDLLNQAKREIEEK